MKEDIDADIYQDVPSREFPHLLMGLAIGEKFEAHIQVQHGFIRGAIFTSCTARWMSPILMNDEDNRLMLMDTIFEYVLESAKAGKDKPKLKLIKEKKK